MNKCLMIFSVFIIFYIIDFTNSNAENFYQGKLYCFFCHNPESLLKPESNSAARSWMRESSRGLPLKSGHGIEWKNRGNHAEHFLSSCDMCHPHHSDSRFPDFALELMSKGGVDCSSGCHEWLGNVEQKGFTNIWGNDNTYSGTIVPADLLLQGDNAHAKIFKQGYFDEKPPASIRVESLIPGCGACHALFNLDHSKTPDCTGCHNFNPYIPTSEHLKHESMIMLERALADPVHLVNEICDYCHGSEDDPADLPNASCYNCHLSGHMPVKQEGGVHFFSILP